MDTTRVTHDAPDDTLETHYSGLERLQPHGCYDGYVYIGRLDVDPETGDEAEIIEAVLCRRCNPQRS